MALTSEDLLAISQLMDAKLDAQLQPLKDDIRDIKLDIENDVKPHIKLLAEIYAPAASKFEEAAEKIEDMKADIDMIKKVVTEHSKKLQMMS